MNGLYSITVFAWHTGEWIKTAVGTAAEALEMVNKYCDEKKGVQVYDLMAKRFVFIKRSIDSEPILDELRKEANQW